MPRQTKQETIDGIEYRVTQVGMETGDEFIFRVGRLMVAASGGMGSLFVALQSMPPSEFKWAVGVLKDSSEMYLVDEAAGPNAKGEMTGRWVKLATVYGDHFAGDRMSAWRKWVAFAMEVNFGRFFDDLLEDMQRRMEASSSSSPKASTGSAGGSSSTSA